MKIETVPVSGLEELARRARNFAVVPMTVHRARSQMLNPLARPGDVAMVTAWDEGRLVGYLGLIPAVLRHDGRRTRVAWMSGFFVAPELNGRGVGRRILQAATALPVDIFTTLYTPTAGRVQEAAGFRVVGELAYAVLDLRRAAPWNLVASRIGLGAVRASRALKRATAGPMRRLACRLLRRGLRAPAAEWERVDQLPAGAAVPPSAEAEFERGREVLNWMVGHPWIVEPGTLAEEPAPGYYFSNVREIFRYVPLVRRGAAAGGVEWLLLSLTRTDAITTLKVLDHAVADPAVAAAAVLEWGERLEAEVLVLPVEMAEPLRRVPLARAMLLAKRRPYMAHLRDPQGELARVLPCVRWHFCDSDAPFL
ncbi:GNAT family N-acetyltransferase [Longimicrobium sp.]|uniref:GNAT family N-acetyltransferase n=1 Tax=Longimicrobium sp. TaxID=2029185 RepID=UPI002BA28781|nr:GNAT family N-acetyltransferase [Longimicrobium sp.]HSU17080.1 GNAT family N-acetyltransferase [Longimicrobium sp.]